MSGGHFDHEQYKLRMMADEIEQIIINNHRKDEYGYSYDYPEDILKEFKKAIEYLNIAEVYVQRIDWLASGDDGEENFRKRLKDDLNKLKGNEDELQENYEKN